MPSSIEIAEKLPPELTDKFYWQALGILKGTLHKDNAATRQREQYSILYRGREYPVFPSRKRFEQRNNFDLDKERLYLVYPTPKAKKPIHLIREDHGAMKAQMIARLPDSIRQLFDADPFAKKILRKQIGLMKAGVLEKLFVVSKAKVAPQDEGFAAAIFNMLKEMMVEQNRELVTEQGLLIAKQILSFLNHACCDQLFHPKASNPEKSFLGLYFRSLKASKERKRPGVLFDTLSFSLVGFSEAEGNMFLSNTGQPLEQKLIDGEFLFSGEWKPWKRDPTKASFISHLNEETDRDLTVTPLGCEKKKKMTIFLDKEEPQLTDKCFGKAIVDFNAGLNTFELVEFKPCKEMHPPLSPKTLADHRKRKSQKNSKKGKGAAQNQAPKPSLDEDLGAKNHLNAVEDTNTVNQLGGRRRKVRNQSLLDDKAAKT